MRRSDQVPPAEAALPKKRGEVFPGTGTSHGTPLPSNIAGSRVPPTAILPVVPVGSVRSTADPMRAAPYGINPSAVDVPNIPISAGLPAIPPRIVPSGTSPIAPPTSYASSSPSSGVAPSRSALYSAAGSGMPMNEQRMGGGFGSGPSQTSTPASSYSVNSTAPASGMWQTAATSAAAAKDVAVGAVGTATDVARQAATTTAATARGAAGTAMGAASMVGSAAGTVRDTTGKAADLAVQGTQAVSGAAGAAADIAYEIVKVPVGLAGDAASLAVHTTGGLMRNVLLSPLWHLDSMLHYANKKIQAVIDNTPGMVHNAETQLKTSGSVSRISLPNSDDGLPGAVSQGSSGKDLTDQDVVIPVKPTTFSALRPSLDLAPAEIPSHTVPDQKLSSDEASAAVHTADDTLRQASPLGIGD
ncbi:MAG: hypothetical protein WDW38_001799 [Sanguina aurantia]